MTLLASTVVARGFSSRKLRCMLVVIAFITACLLAQGSQNNYSRPESMLLSSNSSTALQKTTATSESKWPLPNKQFYILLIINDGFYDFFLNWMHYYKKLNLNNTLIVVAEDQVVYSKLQNLTAGSNDTILVERSDLESGSGPHKWKDPEYIKLVSARPRRILPHLQQGRNILYADVDSVWLRDPFKYIRHNNIDLLIQLDGGGNGKDKLPNYCTGFMSILANNATINLMEQWRQSLERFPQIDQFAFNEVLHSSEVKLNYTGLPSKYFPNGKQYFKQYSQSQRDNVVVVHNNFIAGHSKKRKRFKKAKLWNPY